MNDLELHSLYVYDSTTLTNSFNYSPPGYDVRSSIDDRISKKQYMNHLRKNSIAGRCVEAFNIITVLYVKHVDEDIAPLQNNLDLHKSSQSANLIFNFKTQSFAKSRWNDVLLMSMKYQNAIDVASAESDTSFRKELKKLSCLEHTLNAAGFPACVGIWEMSPNKAPKKQAQTLEKDFIYSIMVIKL